jgi:Uma2 family endonuclease
VVVQRDEPIAYVPMSWEQYLKLPEQPKAEWVRGVAVIMNAPPLFEHGRVMVELTVMLHSALPRLHLVSDVNLRLADDVVRRPDLMVTDVVPPDGWVSVPPLLVVEILSRSTEEVDRGVKASEYADFGIGQYWLVDPRKRTMEVMRNVAGGWHTLALLDDDHPELTVVVGGTAVSLDLREVLRN